MMSKMQKVKINGREFVKCQMINFEFMYPVLSVFAALWSLLLLFKIFVGISFITWTALILSPFIFVGSTMMVFILTMFTIFMFKSCIDKGKCNENCSHGP